MHHRAEKPAYIYFLTCLTVQRCKSFCSKSFQFIFIWLIVVVLMLGGCLLSERSTPDCRGYSPPLPLSRIIDPSRMTHRAPRTVYIFRSVGNIDVRHTYRIIKKTNAFVFRHSSPNVDFVHSGAVEISAFSQAF